MDKHYYLVSQLPMLEFNRPSEMSTGLFVEEAQKWLRHGDFIKLMHIYLFDTSHDDPGPALLKRIKRFEYEFRNDLALWRRARAEAGRGPRRISKEALRNTNRTPSLLPF